MFRDFGVTIAWQGSTIEGVGVIASEADKLGFGYFWLPEAWGLEAFSTVSYILSKTSCIRVGTGVANVYSRSAALIGMGCATLDQIAPSRFLLGLGSSSKSLIESWHGFEFSKPIKRTEEYVRIIKKVVSGEEVRLDGEIIRSLSKFRLFTKPMASNQEIYLGAVGDANLRLAGRICDGAVLATYPSSKLDHAMNLLNDGARGSERKLFTYLPTFISTSEKELSKAKQRVAKNISFYVTSMGTYYAKNLVRLGYEEDVNRIIETRSHVGSQAAAEAVSEEILSELSLIGSPQSVIEKVSKFPKGVIPVLGFDARSSDDVISSVNSMHSLR